MFKRWMMKRRIRRQIRWHQHILAALNEGVRQMEAVDGEVPIVGLQMIRFNVERIGALESALDLLDAHRISSEVAAHA